MKPRLELAMDAIARSSASEGELTEVLRTDLDPSGALVLCCRREVDPVWLQLDGEDLLERSPADDPLLPLAEELRNADEQRPSEVLSYRPGRRLVLRRTDGGTTWVEKGYRRRRWKAAARRHRIAEEATSDGSGFRVPLLRRTRDEHASLTFESLVGRSVSVAETGAETFYAIGAALARFQEAPAMAGAPALFGPEDELQVLDRWARITRDLTGGLPEGWLDAAEALAGLVDSLPEPVVRLAHRDLHDRQLLEVEERIALMDFDLLCRADSCLDPANLLAHLSLRSLQGLEGADEAAITACGRALLEGLAREDETGFWERLRFYEATTFLRLALVYNVRPRWCHLPPDLLELGRRCLEEVR